MAILHTYILLMSHPLPHRTRFLHPDPNPSPPTIRRSGSRPRRIACCLVVGVLAVATVPAAAEPVDQLAFGAEMAGRGLWSEALFRFRQAEKEHPDDPRILNNIAVSLEALGLYEEALDAYRVAVEQAPSLDTAKRNYARFVEFYQAYRGGEEAGEETETADVDREEQPAPTVEPVVDDVEEAADEADPDGALEGRQQV